MPFSLPRGQKDCTDEARRSAGARRIRPGHAPPPLGIKQIIQLPRGIVRGDEVGIDRGADDLDDVRGPVAIGVFEFRGIGGRRCRLVGGRESGRIDRIECGAAIEQIGLHVGCAPLIDDARRHFLERCGGVADLDAWILFLESLNQWTDYLRDDECRIPNDLAFLLRCLDQV